MLYNLCEKPFIECFLVIATIQMIQYNIPHLLIVEFSRFFICRSVDQKNFVINFFIFVFVERIRDSVWYCSFEILKNVMTAILEIIEQSMTQWGSVYDSVWDSFTFWPSSFPLFLSCILYYHPKTIKIVSAIT